MPKTRAMSAAAAAAKAPAAVSSTDEVGKVAVSSETEKKLTTETLTLATLREENARARRAVLDIMRKHEEQIDNIVKVRGFVLGVCTAYYGKLVNSYGMPEYLNIDDALAGPFVAPADATSDKDVASALMSESSRLCMCVMTGRRMLAELGDPDLPAKRAAWSKAWYGP